MTGPRFGIEHGARQGFRRSRFGAGGLAGHPPFGQFVFELVHEGPVDRTGAEVGHMAVGIQAIDRPLHHGVVFAEDRAMAREQPFDIAIANAFEGADEGGQIAAVMGIDRTDSTIAVESIAAEEQDTHEEGEAGITR